MKIVVGPVRRRAGKVETVAHEGTVPHVEVDLLGLRCHHGPGGVA